MPASDFVLFRNVGLDDASTGLQTSSVGEPSVANNGQQVFMTGNWYAARSLDDAASWQYVSPFDALPSAAGGFCCDQLTLYDRSRDLTFWLLQYIKDDQGENVFRIAVKRGATLQNDVWYWWDFSPGGTNADWAGLWFDYPDMALSDDHLWVTFNVFDSTDQWRRAVVFKYPLDALAAGEGLGYSWWSTADHGSLRLTQGASRTMYWGSHTTRTSLRVFAWPGDGDSISFWDVAVSEWNAGPYAAPGPDGRDWLGRCDPRITGAWVTNGVLGYCWTAGPRGGRPHPHVRIVRIDETSKSLVDEPDLWSEQAAWAYPAACPNDRGDVGFSVCYGGESHHPGHVVGVRDAYADPHAFVLSSVSTNGPDRNVWGDYLNVRRHAPDGLTWVASGFTLQGGTGRANVEPRYVHFGRRRDERAVARWRTC